MSFARHPLHQALASRRNHPRRRHADECRYGHIRGFRGDRGRPADIAGHVDCGKGQGRCEVSFVAGTALTAFGRHEGASTLSLMTEAAAAALADAGVERDGVDGLITGYSTTMPHLMLSTVFAEQFGLKPAYAHSIQLGGATGAAMLALADHLIRSGAARRVLVVAGENRLTGQSRDGAIQTL